MRWPALVVGLMIVVSSCSRPVPDLDEERKALAESFFRGVYGCDASVVDDLASPAVVVSYPVFETIYGAGSIKGITEVRAFAERFCGRWADPQITMHEALAEDDRVVLLWGFEARSTVPPDDGVPGEARQSWGGISMFRFDELGKIVLEVGEESDPGPFARLNEERAGAN
jgi:hypothetical protein